MRFPSHTLYLGRLADGTLALHGAIDEFLVTHRKLSLAGLVPEAPWNPAPGDLVLCDFDALAKGRLQNRVHPSPLTLRLRSALAFPKGARFLDEVQAEEFARSTLHGSEACEAESQLPQRLVKPLLLARFSPAPAPEKFSLDGKWKLKSATHRLEPSLEEARFATVPGEGVREGWYRAGYDRSDWLEVTVPTTVQAALVKAGLLPDPLWGDNTWRLLQKEGWPENLPWQFRQTPIERKDWWFARTFHLPKRLTGKRLRLHFDGVDYWASFYLNGAPLGWHEGMFGGPDYDVSRLVKFDEPNELVVRVDRVPESWSNVLKGNPGWGWHYGHLISLGLWRGVWLEVVPDLELQAPFVWTSKLTSDDWCCSCSTRPAWLDSPGSSLTCTW